MTKKIDLYQCAIYVIMICLLLICVLPFALMLVASFSSESSILRNGYTFTPDGLSLDSYLYLFSSSYNILKAYFVSAFVTILGTFLGLVLTISLAYPLSRTGMPGKNVIAFFVFFTMLFNGGLIPTYIMWTTVFSIKNTYAAYILPNLLARAFYIMMMRTYFTTSIPESILESARIDGANRLMVFTKIVLPLVRPGIVSTAIYVFINAWNEFLYALLLVSSSDKTTLSVAVKTLEGADILNWGSMMAASAIVVLPSIFFFCLIQNKLAGGLADGAVK